MLRRLSLFLALSALLPGATRPAATARAEAPPAAPAEPSAEQLKARVLALLAAQPEDETRGPLEQAKLALARAESAAGARDNEQAERSLALARAALALGEARHALARERALLAAAKVRRDRSRERAERSHVLLDKAKAQLASPATVDAGAP